MRRCILVALDWTRPKDPPLSLGHASILASLRAERLPVHPLSFSANSPQTKAENIATEILNAIGKEDASRTVVALGAYVWAENLVQKITEYLRDAGFLGDIVIGGPQVSYCPKGVLDDLYPPASVFIRGYAERALGDVLRVLPPRFKTNLVGMSGVKTAGIHVRGTSDTGTHGQVDLASLPSPFLRNVVRPQRFIRWETQRGCPFSCTFCQHREPNSSMKRRHFDESRIVREADWLARNHVTDVAVLDPTFNAGKRYIGILERLLANGFVGKLSLQCRFEMVKPEFLDVLRRLRRVGVDVLPEFGLQTINRDEELVIGRRNNINRVDDVMRALNADGIPYEISLIYGLPLQTVDSFRRSVNFCLERRVPVLRAFPLMLLRGTPLESKRDAFRLVESVEAPFPGTDDGSRILTGGIPHVVSSSTFSVNEWREMAEISALLDHTQGRHPTKID